MGFGWGAQEGRGGRGAVERNGSRGGGDGGGGGGAKIGGRQATNQKYNMGRHSNLAANSITTAVIPHWEQTRACFCHWMGLALNDGRCICICIGWRGGSSFPLSMQYRPEQRGEKSLPSIFLINIGFVWGQSDRLSTVNEGIPRRPKESCRGIYHMLGVPQAGRTALASISYIFDRIL